MGISGFSGFGLNKTMSQGYKLANDGHTSRYDKVIKEVPDVVKIVDDNLQ